jgi:hypothetical protein
MKFERDEDHALPDHNAPFYEDCTYLLGQGYAHIVCAITEEFHCETLSEARYELTISGTCNYYQLRRHHHHHHQQQQQQQQQQHTTTPFWYVL